MADLQYEAGDLAYILSGSTWRYHLSSQKVAKVTPTGIIVLENGERYNKHGRQSRKGYGGPRLIYGDELSRYQKLLRAQNMWDNLYVAVEACQSHVRSKNLGDLRMAAQALLDMIPSAPEKEG